MKMPGEFKGESMMADSIMAELPGWKHPDQGTDYLNQLRVDMGQLIICMCFLLIVGLSMFLAGLYYNIDNIRGML